jgi:hypothetical protein
MATPAYRVRIDFNQDGDFTDTNENVTSDVRTTGMGMKLKRAKTMQGHKASAAILEIILNNEDHKYSPSFSDSPLYPYVLPSPYIWVEIAYPMDDFIASNGTTLSSRTPTYDSVFGTWSGDAGSFDIQSNKLRSTSAGNYTAVLDFANTDCHAAVDFTRGGAIGGLILRYEDASNFLIIYPTNTNIILAKVDGGSLSTLATATIKNHAGTDITWGAGTSKRIGTETHGNEVRVFVDDVYQYSHTTTVGNDQTKFGVGGRSTHANDRWENFGGWRSVFYGRIDSIQPKPETENQLCYMRAFDDFERFNQHQIYKVSPTGSATTHPDDTFNVILDATDFSSQNRIMDEGTNLNKFERNEKPLSRNALAEIYQLQDDDVGFAYIDGSGIFRYEDSKHRQSAPHTTNISEWKTVRSDPPVETDKELSGEKFEWEDGKSYVENEIWYEYTLLSYASADIIWQLSSLTASTGDRPLIKAGATASFLIAGDGDQILNPQVPLHDTDFDLNTAVDASGTNLLLAEDTEQNTVTASGSSAFTLADVGSGSAGQDFSDWNDGKHQVVITDNGGDRATAWIGTSLADSNRRVELYTSSALSTLGYAYKDANFSESDTPLTYKVFNVTVELAEGFDGNYRRLDIYNGSGANGYLTLARVKGEKGSYGSTLAARAEDATSQLEVGRRRIQHKTLHIDRYGGVNIDGTPSDEGSALDRARTRLNLRKQRKEIVKCSMPNSTKANMMEILHRSISDRVRVTYASMGVDDGYHIEGFILSCSNGGMLVECEWLLQQAPGGPYGEIRFGQSLFS